MLPAACLKPPMKPQFASQRPLAMSAKFAKSQVSLGMEGQHALLAGTENGGQVILRHLGSDAKHDVHFVPSQFERSIPVAVSLQQQD